MRLNAPRKPKQNAYLALVARFPLRPIRSMRRLEEAHEIVNSLLSRHLGPDERDYLEVLSKLIEEYEEKHFPMDSPSEAEMLRHLLEEKGVSQSRLAREAGIAESTISAILSEERRLSITHIRKLAQFFKVEPGVFL